ncbi:MAG: hypothetical protein K2W95_02950 [Candidatus Obscuribacterales bacterium]|nr:hypothetical protein [Candidatus Obscuribacterales bacterium]
MSSQPKNFADLAAVRRRARAQSLIELVAILLLAIPMILVLFDASVIMMAVATNDAACRDAARAASSGPPGLLAAGSRSVNNGDAPSKRASAVLKRIYAPSGYLKILDHVEVAETIKTPVPSATAGGAVIGEVTVRTSAEVYPPFIVGHFVGELPLHFKKEETYNYTYVVPIAAAP